MERYRKIKILRRLLLQILFPIFDQVHMMKHKNRRKRRWKGRRRKRRGGELIGHSSHNLPEVKKCFLVHFNRHPTSLNLQIIS
jgi:hypothetical protein